MLKLTGKIQNPKWKVLKYKCHKTDLELQHPFIDCKFCKFTERENSCPTKEFKNTEGEEVTEIFLTYGKYDDLQGWGWN